MESGSADKTMEEDNSPEMKSSEETNGGRAGPKSHEQRGQKGQRQLFDCHQYCGIICVVILITEFNLFHFHV